MNKENCLIYEADNKSIILFDFNNIDIETALNKINNDNIQSLFCIGLNEDDIALNEGVEARIEVDSNLLDKISINRSLGVKQSLSELYNLQKMACNIKAHNEFMDAYFALDMNIDNELIKAMNIQISEYNRKIRFRTVAYEKCEETVEPLIVGNYEVECIYSMLEFEPRCSDVLNDEAIDLVKYAIKNYRTTSVITIKLRQ